MNGFLLIDKPAGMTSFDLVRKIRYLSGEKKTGHTGTLDPDATGLMIVLIGRATRAESLLNYDSKSYDAEMILGMATDTEDISGTIIDKKDIPESLNEADIKEAVLSFIGEYDQIPPMYSAKKINGKRLYDIARSGKTVERKSCRVKINSIDKIIVNNNRISFSVTCSAGTYIRSLCRDIGAGLGLPACMSCLRRTSVGRFDISDAARLDSLKDISDLEENIRPVGDLFMNYEAVTVLPEAYKYLMNGNRMYPEELGIDRKYPAGTVVRVYRDGDSDISALYTLDDTGEYKALKMFI